MRRELMQDIVDQNFGAVQIEKCGRRKDRLRLRTGRSVAVVLGRCSPDACGQLRWTISRSPYEHRRVTLLALLTPQNNRIHSLHLSTHITRLDATLRETDFSEFGLSAVTVVTNFLDQVQRLRSE